MSQTYVQTLIKLSYFEKATKFEKNLPLDLKFNQ